MMLSFVCIRGCVVGRLVFEMWRLCVWRLEADVRQEAASHMMGQGVFTVGNLMSWFVRLALRGVMSFK